MPGPITFGGLASGLPANLVDQLIEAEKIPIKTIEKNKGKQENRLKLVTELETKLTVRGVDITSVSVCVLRKLSTALTPSAFR